MSKVYYCPMTIDKSMIYHNIEKQSNEKSNYTELRDEIHKILCEFLEYEIPIRNDGEFDFEYMESCTDDILRLMKKQGVAYT